MNFRSYKEYADSNSHWIGRIPSHWDVLPLKRLARIENSGTYGDDIENEGHTLPVATTAQITPEGNLETHKMSVRAFSDTEVARYQCEIGDIVVVKSSGSIDNIITGKAALVTEATEPFVFSNFLARARAYQHVCIPKFLFHLLTCHLTRERVKMMCSSTTYPNLRMGDYCSAPLPCPPIEEQRVITDFLDQETARIDALIEEQKRLTGLLREKRTVTVSTAVTKGLEPSVRMKDSLMSYLGNVPNHWNLVPLRYLVKEPLEYGANESAEEENPSHPRFIRITDFDDSGNLRSETFRSLPWEVARPYLLKEGDILLARSGATVGKAFIYSAESGPACYAGYLIRARPDRKKIDPDFLSRYLRSAQYWEYINSVTIQATIQNVSAERYGNVLVPVPPLDEQKEILRHLDFAEKNEERLLTEARSGISLLQERRAALVSAAVTGKIDVREWEHSTPSTEEALPQAAEKEGRYG